MRANKWLVFLVVGVFASLYAWANAANATTHQDPPDGQATITVAEEADPNSTVAFKFGGSFGAFTLVDSADYASAASRTFTVDPGTYRIRQQMFSAWSVESIECTTLDGVADVEIKLDKSLAIVSADAGDAITCTFSNSRAAVVRIRVGEDQNGDGQRNADDPWIEGATIEVRSADGTIVETKLTGAQGRARFDIPPGTYTVCELLRDGWTNTRPGEPAVSDGRACVDVTASAGQRLWLRFFDQPPNVSIDCAVPVWIVANFDQLSEAIRCFNGVAPGTDASITLTADIVHSADVPAISNPGPATSLTLDGRGNEIDANSMGNGLIVLPDTTFILADATLTGGAIGVLNNGHLTIERTTIEGFTNGGILSRRVGGLGSLTIIDSLITENKGTLGPGIANIGNFPTEIVRSTIAENTASRRAGGIYHAGGPMIIRESSISHNTVEPDDRYQSDGGGILSFGQLTIIDSTVNSNTAQYGGGILSAGTLHMVNSTVSDNLGRKRGGGITTSEAVLIHSTVTGNKSAAGSGIFGLFGTVELTASIVSGNKRSADVALRFPAGGDVFSSGGFNVIGDVTTEVTAFELDGTGIDALLGPLAANGGSTLTHLPAVDSPAIDIATNILDAPLTDQRGFTRPNIFSDAGSVEREA